MADGNKMETPSSTNIAKISFSIDSLLSKNYNNQPIKQNSIENPSENFLISENEPKDESDFCNQQPIDLLSSLRSKYFVSPSNSRMDHLNFAERQICEPPNLLKCDNESKYDENVYCSDVASMSTSDLDNEDFEEILSNQSSSKYLQAFGNDAAEAERVEDAAGCASVSDVDVENDNYGKDGCIFYMRFQ